MNQIEKVVNNKQNIFEDIKHLDSSGKEYWEARELQVALEYAKWQKFLNVINKAIIACKNSGLNPDEQLIQVGKLSERANNTKVQIVDYRLTRYACYLIVQNSDPNKEVVALGQTYFAIQTRKQELSEKEDTELLENEKRFYNRGITRKENYQLNQTAKKVGVKNFGEFHNAGYKGLYHGETADEIAKRKKLRYREDILDNMSSDELATNIFRISQTKQKIENENIQGENNAKKAHYQIGKNVRKFIEENGGTMPEKLPTPKKSLKELEKDRKKSRNRIKAF